MQREQIYLRNFILGKKCVILIFPSLLTFSHTHINSKKVFVILLIEMLIRYFFSMLSLFSL